MLIQKRLKLDCVAAPLDSTGILTRFPFIGYELRADLGSTDPHLMIVDEEPLPLRRWGFSPQFAATFDRILIPAGSTPPLGDASTPARRLLTKPLVAVLESRRPA